jgi:hypothetical protein
MRRFLAAAAMTVALLPAVAACANGTPTADPSASATAPTASSSAVVTGSPAPSVSGSQSATCATATDAINRLKALEAKYLVAVGSDPTKAAAAKAEVQTEMKSIAAQLRSAGSTATSNALKQAAETGATVLETAATNEAFFSPKNEADAKAAFSTAALYGVPAIQSAFCS